MSTFACEVVRVQIEPHPNADAIELARVGDYLSIVKKGQFSSGDIAVYIPEQAVLPEWLLKKMGFWDDLNGKGMLTGSQGNRVRAMKLRGVLSQGLLLNGPQVKEGSVDGAAADFTSVGIAIHYPERDDGAAFHTAYEGEDVSEHLGVVKYEPVIPAQMAGRCIGANMDITHGYDFDNIKKMPDLFEPDEDVVITEKIHGTLLQISVVPASMANEKFYKGRVVITSKGLGGRGIILDHDDESNVYAQAVKKFGLLDKMLEEFGRTADALDQPHLMFGEVFGGNVQDLGYSANTEYRAFDICFGVRNNAVFLDQDQFKDACEGMGVAMVPLLYEGPFSREVMLAHTDGKETVSGKSCHIREGVVVKARDGSRHRRHGRKIAKSISAAYLLRKGNTTEFQ